MDYEGKKRTDWIFDHPCQLVLTVSQIYWCREVAASLASEDGAQGLRDYQQECYRNLGDLADLTARKLNKIERRMLGTLITTDVHSRDLVDQVRGLGGGVRCGAQSVVSPGLHVSRGSLDVLRFRDIGISGTQLRSSLAGGYLGGGGVRMKVCGGGEKRGGGAGKC